MRLAPRQMRRFVRIVVATVFRRSGSPIWSAAFRAWDAAAGRWRWVQRSTGVEDKAAAAGIAARLEAAAGSAKAGTMTRERALDLVNDILTLAGLDKLAPVPSLRACALAFLDAATVSAGTLRKYTAHWESLEAWAGPRADAPVDSFGVEDMQAFYSAVRKRLSATTAADHLNFASMLFGRAVAQGHRSNNPCLAVVKTAPDGVEKVPITRGETAALLRLARKRRRRDWAALIALGWNTGHRLQDLLDLTAERIDGDLVTITPRKKSRRGGRTIVLPIPRWLAAMVRRLGSFKTIHHADNRNGKVSEDFVAMLRAAGIDPKPIKRGVRVVHLRSFHSFRHAMQTRLTAGGVSGELARLVTDHDDVKIAQKYTHREIQALREALAVARRR